MFFFFFFFFFLLLLLFSPFLQRGIIFVTVCLLSWMLMLLGPIPKESHSFGKRQKRGKDENGLVTAHLF